ncbi:MAG: aminotransferase class V-fold PLP-dependent enzyme [Caldilineaceae bacterium]
MTSTIYDTLNVRPVINAIGTFTRLSGSLMAPEVVQAMAEASRHFVLMEDLQFQASKVIAELTGAEAGYVTSGAQAGLVLSMAACITGLDPHKMDKLPHTEEMPNQVIMAKAHRNHYDHAVEAAGGRLVEVGSDELCRPADIEAAINAQTVAVLHLPWPQGQITLAETAAVAHRHHIPVVVDGAGKLDDPANLRNLIAQGADLVVFSGGKYIRGPQASGFVAGRRDLIAAIAWQHLDMDAVQEVWTAPRELLGVERMPFMPRQGIGRGYKAGKEEIVGLITALRLFVQRDHAAEKARCARQVQNIVDGLADVTHIHAEVMPPELGRALPLARVRIDQQALGMSGNDFILALKTGEPSIHPLERELAQGAVVVHPFGLQAGDDLKIVRRIREIVGA